MGLRHREAAFISKALFVTRIFLPTITLPLQGVQTRKPFNPIGWACERVRADGGEGVLPTAAFGLCVPPCGPLHQRSPCSEGRCLQLASGREGCPFHKHEARDRQAPDWDHVTGRAFLVGTKDSSLLVSLNMCPESLSSASNCNCNPESKSYIAAAFVKWVEAAGGRPVPIRFYNSEAELYRLFKQLNGLVFPGGLTWLWLESPYVLAALKFIQLSTASRTQHIRISITHARLSAGWPHMAVAGQPICPGCTQALPMGSPGKRRWRPFPGKAPALACDVP
eukprot:scaffold196153_cov18-Tisochrysis_lutea.AAC.1